MLVIHLVSNKHSPRMLQGVTAVPPSWDFHNDYANVSWTPAAIEKWRLFKTFVCNSKLKGHFLFGHFFTLGFFFFLPNYSKGDLNKCVQSTLQLLQSCLEVCFLFFKKKCIKQLCFIQKSIFFLHKKKFFPPGFNTADHSNISPTDEIDHLYLLKDCGWQTDVFILTSND